MATFQYVKKGGGMGAIQAADSAAALAMLPQDADPRSGIIAAGGASGGGVAPSPSTPNPSGAGASANKLGSFADSLDAAVNLARKSRNKSSLDIMKPYRGTVAASDFNSILNNMNTASDRTSENLIKRATEAEKAPDYKLVTNDNGDVTALDPTTGAIAWTAKGVGNKQTGGGGAGTLITSGALVYGRDDYSEDASSLETSRGDDGWVDPTVYQSLYDAWVSNGGKIADFVKTFPPTNYVNPENDWLPVYLRPKKTAGSRNPFED